MRLKFIPAFFLSLILFTACTPARPSAQVVDAARIPPTAVANHAVETAVAQDALATMVARTMQAPTATPTLPTPPTPTVTFTPAPSPTPAPSMEPGQPDAQLLQARPQYKLDVDFSFAERYGKVTEEIQYTNRSGDALPELRLMVELFAYKGLFSFTGLWWQDGTKIEDASWEDIQLRIPLRQPLEPGQSVGLKVTYEFRLPAQSTLGGERPLPIGYTGRQANLVDWYPFIPPYRSGTGWLAHPPAYYGEHLVSDLADFEVNLRLLDQRSDLVVAASAPEQKEGEWLRYKQAAVRSFALSVGDEYQTQSAQVGDITITSYYFPLNLKAGKQALQTTVEAVKLYQDLFGPYPHKTLAVVEADFFDGMEYDGLYFLSRAFYNIYAGTPDEYLVAIAAHETAHQWFFALVGNDQANEPWLDEALATYCERLYYEHYTPKSLEWWWYYRINYDKPSGWVDTSVYNPQGNLQTYQDYRNAVYLNGAHFIEDLRRTVGDEIFFAFLKDYVAKYSGQIALSSDFFALLAKHTKADITPIKQKYFMHP